AASPLALWLFAVGPPRRGPGTGWASRGPQPVPAGESPRFPAPARRGAVSQAGPAVLGPLSAVLGGHAGRPREGPAAAAARAGADRAADAVGLQLAHPLQDRQALSRHPRGRSPSGSAAVTG